jgi:hypothetical protein
MKGQVLGALPALATLVPKVMVLATLALVTMAESATAGAVEAAAEFLDGLASATAALGDAARRRSSEGPRLW